MFNLMDILKLETPLKNPTSSMKDCFLHRNTFLAQLKLVQKLTFTNTVPKMVKRSSLKKILTKKMTTRICDESAYILL